MAGLALTHKDYTVGWICALGVEQAAARALLDQEHPRLPSIPGDPNRYRFGSIAGHNVVIACLPDGETGNNPAATVATRMAINFPLLEFGLMVGIGGGVPTPPDYDDIRLGDIVVSSATGEFGGVVQYDCGKTVQEGAFKRTGSLNRPPEVLRQAVADLRATYRLGHGKLAENLAQMVSEYDTFARPTATPGSQDALFKPDYDHPTGFGFPTCGSCDTTRIVQRSPRSPKPVVHYGVIASGNQVMRNGSERDRISRELGGVLCFEMEAAGLMNTFPCLVIKGICDYSDSHKNKEWQAYAAAAAAVYTKELLGEIEPARVHQTQASGAVMTRIGALEPDFNVQFDLKGVPKTNTFIGRDSDLDLMRQYLVPVIESNKRKICVLHGLGGIGKTQLAIEYARLFKHIYTSFFWLDGKTEESLVQSLLSIASRLPTGQISNIDIHEIKGMEDSKEKAQEVLQWFALEGNSKWLLVFDNIDKTSYDASPNDAESQSSYDITEYFPRGDLGAIIITTRLQRLTTLGDRIHLRRIDVRNGVSILEKHSRKSFTRSSGLAAREKIEIENFDPDAVALVERLEGLPLALVLAGSYISRTTIGKYLELYSQSWNDLHKRMDIRRDYPERTIMTTWKISYDELKRKDKGAAKLLQLWGYLDNQDIWFQLLQWPGYQPHAPSWLRQITTTEISFLETIQTLLGYSLIEQKESSESYSMHTVVHDWIRESVNKDEDGTLLRVGLTTIGLVVPDKNEKDYWIMQRRLLPHAIRLSQLSYKQQIFSLHLNEVDNIVYLDGLHNLGGLYRDQGRLAEAEAMYQRALAGRERALGPDHTSTLSTVNNLGNLYRDQGRLAEAEAMYQRALARSSQ